MLPPPTTFASYPRASAPSLGPYFPFTPLAGPSQPRPTASPGSPLAPGLPYPFQIVQTPGGTARAGWWIPPEHVPLERRRGARRVSEGVANEEARTALGEKAKDRVRELLEKERDAELKETLVEEELMFQPA